VGVGGKGEKRIKGRKSGEKVEEVSATLSSTGEMELNHGSEEVSLVTPLLTMGEKKRFTTYDPMQKGGAKDHSTW
jgi:hypothetical protein